MNPRSNPQAALELLILTSPAAGPHHGFTAPHIEEAPLHRLEKAGLIASRATLTEGARRVLQWA